MSDPQQHAASAPAQGNGKRKRMMTLLAAVIAIAAIAYGLYYFLVARFHESTDDAYVNGNVVQITPQVVGTVIAVNADDTQTVKIGDPLVQLDPADSRIALQQAEANLGQTVRQVRGLFADDLFVRTQTGMEPTAHAREIAPLGQRDAQVADLPPVAVVHGGRHTRRGRYRSRAGLAEPVNRAATPGGARRRCSPAAPAGTWVGGSRTRSPRRGS